MKKLLLIYFLLILTSCENSENNMTVKVNVENFKKGNIYLQKISDSTFTLIIMLFSLFSQLIEISNKVIKYNFFKII